MNHNGLYKSSSELKFNALPFDNLIILNITTIQIGTEIAITFILC